MLRGSRELLKGAALQQEAERLEAYGHIRKELLLRVPDAESNDAERVLLARNPFQARRNMWDGGPRGTDSRASTRHHLSRSHLGTDRCSISDHIMHDYGRLSSGAYKS